MKETLIPIIYWTIKAINETLKEGNLIFIHSIHKIIKEEQHEF